MRNKNTTPCQMCPGGWRKKKKKYKKGEKFFEVTFEIPQQDLRDRDIVELVEEAFDSPCNIKIALCELVIKPKRLSVCKDEFHPDITYNAKEK